MRQRLRKLSEQMAYIPWAFGFVWQSAHGWMLVWSLLLLVASILPVLVVILTRDTVNALVTLIESNGQNLNEVAVLVILLALVMVAQAYLAGIQAWVRTVLSENVQDYMSNVIHEKAITLDLSYFETADYYDKLYRALFEARGRPANLLESIGSLLQNSLTLLGMLGILIVYAWWLPLVLLIGTIPALWVVLRYTVHYNDWRNANTQHERRSQYYTALITDREAAAEFRLFSTGRYYINLFADLRAKIRSEKLRLERNKMLSELFAVTLGLATTGLVILWMIGQTLQGLAQLGDIAAFYQIFSQGQSLMRTVMNNTGTIYQNVLFLENLYEFLHLEPELRDDPGQAMIPMPLKKSIRFEDVTFLYPGSASPALSNFNWEIPAGKTVALVGENGEGKSTLMKLLCRFYDPQNGRILWDGVDLREIPLDDLRRQVSILFQEPYRYHESAFHNIAIGDLESSPTLEDVEKAARVAGADKPVSSLPEGFDTVLSKWFGGVELSGGEWQRVALARAFLRRAHIIILDEPTSSMDSWAEIDWLERFRQIAQDKTAIMITHRFTTAMYADMIYVMHEGTITESGTHQELVNSGGRYAQSWQAQMQEIRPLEIQL